MIVLELLFKNTERILTSFTSLTAIVLSFLVYFQNNKAKKLQEEIERLKKRIHRVTSKVDPETDRKLIQDATTSIQILGINALGPLHHCREELIDFLTVKKGNVQIIILDPKSKSFEERERKEHDSVRRIYTEWKATLRILKDIEIKAKAKDKIEIRLSWDKPNRSLLIIDSLNKKGLNDGSKMAINYYPDEEGTRGYSGEQFMSEYILERDRDSFYKNMDFFKRIWDQSTPQDCDELINKTE